MRKIQSVFTSFIDLFFPNLCVACNENLLRGELHICTKCISDMPKTNFHLISENEVEKRFWGKVRIENATSFFYFDKGSRFQHLLHELKYKGNKEIGDYLGRLAAADLLQTDRFSSVDVIVPVPLHPKKEYKRGYNQSEWIGKGMSAIFNKPLSVGNLIRVSENTTQTQKSVFERFENTKGIFQIRNKAEFNHKHILLIDDVLTTGSTLEACVHPLLECEDVRISIFTLAVAK